MQPRHFIGKSGEVNKVKQVLTVKEVAELMGFSTSTIVRLFQNEPGVIVKVSPSIDTRKQFKRRYRSFRIPRHVYERVLARLTK